MTSSASPAPFEELASLRAQIVERDVLLEERAATIARHEATIEQLHEQVRLLLARRFGASSEKLPDAQLGLFNEAEAGAAEEPEADAGTEVAAHRRARPVRAPLPESLERVDIEHELAQSERTCPHHGVELERFAEVVSEQLDIVPAKVRVLRHIRGKYRCPSCEGHLRTAALPAQPLPKSFASAGLLAFIVTAKYLDGLPLYRQQQQFGRIGVDPGSPGNPAIFFARSYYRGVDRSAWQREYFRDYYAQDEHLPRLRALPDSKIVGVADLFSERELKTSRMYNEMLARVDGQNGLNVRLDGPGGSQIVWGIADPVDAGAWSSSQIDMVARVLPHLRQYVRVRSALIDAGALGASAIRLLDNAQAGVIQLDRSGRVVEANDAARALLRRNDGLSDRDGALRAAAPADNDRLQALLARALPRFGARGASGSMMVRRSSPLPRLAVHVTPVANGTGATRRASV